MINLTNVALHDVLLVEDSLADVVLMQEAVQESMPHTRLSVAGHGVDALRFLRREASFEDAPRPDLILLDLNMPLKGGLEVLSDLRDDPELRSIPVLVLSTSDRREDVERAYDLGANTYLVKPRDLPGFFALMQQMNDYWFRSARLPQGNKW
ncbi:response regulator [Deinococcus peraridilitoris]|uniref:CheY-like receiver domain-containing protein n=1 Tax=Deinococcus peraridilitoris (strain DSM 19664 / LMG 22246 / CIP 109416 / KR-200) TaxID=937777 RepID=L0A996_DEIPD|nr:response regulator [Deinococcus peraridilitoris]AFZ69610.1 CheY-like receiver domain-containing protein [Deinococcus peraridilitoris DSM 19664]